MTILLQDNGKYCVTKFEGTHNHPVLSLKVSNMLRLHEEMKVAHAAQDSLANKPRKYPRVYPRIYPKPSLEFMGQARGIQKLGFVHADYSNYLHAKMKRNNYNNSLSVKRKKKMEKGSAGVILKYFENLQDENMLSFHSIQLDAGDQITNIFWADVKMVADYNYFGDVVCFDTTFRINDDEQLFATFIGVNHHKKIVIFGAALLYDESIESFTWVFQSFLKAMSGKQPKTILIGQDSTMENAIKQVFPEAYHRFCLSYISKCG
ncbi:PREDICTED: protein FAR1-RELATED SEQUENCE 5-like [Nelumbo nucifera]|uniref:Protein FAR1-RELATED SEQUENCE n=1 Tax=Nelumbo nucifera TaxID=4432 RepID=A0A1U7Z0I1_NELNU|nr:PREDICTED: protein FAR1-RELATED SEQUENCE 5-like [Nelumbo nucifera]